MSDVPIISKPTLAIARLVLDVEELARVQGVKLRYSPRIRAVEALLGGSESAPADFEGTLHRLRDEWEIQIARIRRTG